ncbi:F-box/WD repeat-containing protein 5 [Copidosoma floridanum]|uniref:F-box/WD repeat-containing protein 5 n=1 Tax=Copidosoma floridanum TaxID=29053 RepID=UPI0006C96E92|nr:F-box/WD repeat-containing protein 5 [Copidosoma floridanum]XP_014210329.1 F-box/WD repeat-containing protein 5 [Copidosoma floridanum]XP_014210331.1 F-box/WD repeat-containing protein 5 [Copidosoma floridanum]
MEAEDVVEVVVVDAPAAATEAMEQPESEAEADPDDAKESDVTAVSEDAISHQMKEDHEIMQQEDLQTETSDTAELNVEQQAEHQEDEEMLCDDRWSYMPDSVMLSIFQYLSPKELLTAGGTCRTWNRVSEDEMLWKALFYRTYKVDPNVGIMPGKTSWFEEFKRLAYHIPLVETETLREHSHQVLHVSFSHNGKMFATCSKDGYILVWNSQHPVSIKYHHDMKTFSWKYTQFSQFNSSDTLLLVSGVHFGTPHSTSGEIAVFRLAPSFELQCRVMNKPYDIFGTWYSERYLLSGGLHWLAHLVSTSILWLNKANQETGSEHVPIMNQLYRFYNGNASSIRAVMVANCLSPAATETDAQNNQPSSSDVKEEKGNPLSHRDISMASTSQGTKEEPEVLHHASSRLQYSTLEGGFMNWRKLGDGFEYASPIKYNNEYRQVEMEKEVVDSDNSDNESSPPWEDSEEEDSLSAEEFDDSDDLADCPEKFLIFTTGSKTYTPHQVGFKRIKPVTFPRRLDPGPSLQERIAQRHREREMQNSGSLRPEPNWLDYDSVADKFDKIDHLIDLHGHIIGMGLSPDHRYLYINTRPWPRGYVITNPLQPPPIAQEIDIHVIDLVTLKQVGTMLRAHKAYTPNNECFFIFLDVCNEYVASGAEDKHGYLWDRHYGVCLAKFPHSDVVNSVAFNPRDTEMLVTTSDDYTIKVWRSRAMVKSLGLDEVAYRRGMEVRNRRKYHRSNCNVD